MFIELKSKVESKIRLPIILKFSESHCNAGTHVCSVSDPYHFDLDPDPDPRIRIRDDGS